MKASKLYEQYILICSAARSPLQVLCCVCNLVHVYDINLTHQDYHDLLSIKYSLSTSQHVLEAAKNVDIVKTVRCSLNIEVCTSLCTIMVLSTRHARS